MLKSESEWIASVLFSDAEYFPLLNVGSQSEFFRKNQQSHIDARIFAPAREMGKKVIHTDLQDLPGVDLVGDLCDRNFLKILREQCCQSVLCSNLLEHVSSEMRVDICKSLAAVIEEKGRVIITVPFKFPYHPDPIDTYYRPSTQEIATLFPEFKVVEEKQLYGTTLFEKFYKSPQYAFTTIVRSLMPFYRYNNWRGVVHGYCWLFRRPVISAVVLQKK